MLDENLFGLNEYSNSLRRILVWIKKKFFCPHYTES